MKWLIGVIATNTVRLGEDVGALGVPLHVGSPPTVRAVREKGREEGRKEKDR